YVLRFSGRTGAAWNQQHLAHGITRRRREKPRVLAGSAEAGGRRDRRGGRGRRPADLAVRGRRRPAPGAGRRRHGLVCAVGSPYETPSHAWTQRLRELGVPNSGEIDRFYFRSLYFREPNGILFEIATDGPGFATDEPLQTLGEKLALPPFLEPRRKEIEAGLKPLG